MKQIAVLSFLVIIISCGKFDKAHDDGKGDSYIRGRLFLYDTITKSIVDTPLGNKTINLSYHESTDTINFLFSTTTDKDGYFIFQSLRKDKQYKLLYNEQVANNIIYTAETDNITPPKDTIALTAYPNTARESGLQYTIKDSTGAGIKGASVCIYANPGFFRSGTCDNSKYSLTTDDNGKCFQFNIPQNTYYVTAYIQANNALYVADDTINVTEVTIFRTIYLKRKLQTGYNLHIVDENGAPLSGVNLCFFTSSLLYNNGDCAGSNFQNATDVNGNALATSVNPGMYYVLADKKLTGLELAGSDTISIVKDQILNDTLIIKKK